MLESIFKKAAGLKACNFIKKRLQHRCFPVNFAKYLRIPFVTGHLHRWLLLEGICVRTSLVKILQPCHFHTLKSITDASERCPLRNTMNNRDW